MKGWRTYAVGLFFVLAPVALDYLAKVDWTTLVNAKWSPVILGAIMIAMRSITNTPPTKEV